MLLAFSHDFAIQLFFSSPQLRIPSLISAHYGRYRHRRECLRDAGGRRLFVG
jgi:hypothetical protein